jgi:hypothetical protein
MWIRVLGWPVWPVEPVAPVQIRRMSDFIFLTNGLNPNHVSILSRSDEFLNIHKNSCEILLWRGNTAMGT